MRYLAFALAAVMAVLAIQHGTAQKSVLLSGDTLNVLELQRTAGNNLPEMTIARSY
jgi:hypothetical protein